MRRILSGAVAAVFAMSGTFFERARQFDRVGSGRRDVTSLHRRLGRSKHLPHQGARECARRRARLARGIAA